MRMQLTLAPSPGPARSCGHSMWPWPRCSSVEISPANITLGCACPALQVTQTHTMPCCCNQVADVVAQACLLPCPPWVDTCCLVPTSAMDLSMGEAPVLSLPTMSLAANTQHLYHMCHKLCRANLLMRDRTPLPHDAHITWYLGMEAPPADVAEVRPAMQSMAALQVADPVVAALNVVLVTKAREPSPPD
jgi:hypothetical protein